jgi:glycosyltransferase involved in cell wall biosynthesis
MSGDNPLRIGLVTGEYPPMQGGVGDFTQALAHALVALGVEIHVITGRSARPPASALPAPSTHPIISRWSFLALWQIRRLAQHLNLQLLNVQYQAAAFQLGAPIHFLPKITGRPTVVTFHDLRIPYLFPKAGRLREGAVTYLARSAAGVIATDLADEAELKRRGGLRALTQIPIGSNIDPAPPAHYDRAAWRGRANIGQREFLIGYFGFLNESKGGDTLMSALAILQDRQANAKLALIGGQTGASDPTNAVFNAKIERLITRYGLENRIFRTGFLDQAAVSAWLLACDAVVLPYRDGVSLRRGTLMAALAHGRPVITTTPHVPLPGFVDGENIRFVPPEDAPALVLAISQLLEAPELRAQMGERAQRLARQFEWPAIAAQTLAFYRQAL